MIQRKSLRAGQGHIVDGSSALVVNDSQSSDDEQEIQTLVVSRNERKNKEPQKQVILELEEDKFYTLDELDELDQSMSYLARKFSNIRVKKPKFFKNKGQTSNKDNSWKGKAQYNSGGKSGYKTRSIDMSKIRCFNYDELGHFATECRKPKKVKKDKAYLELEANPFKETVEKMSMEMFYIHTSLVAAIEEVSRLSKANEKLDIEKQDLKQQLVELKTVKQENEYLKNKLKNASQLVGQYHEKNNPCANISIGLDYDALNNNRKVDSDRGKVTISEDVPVMLRKVGSPMFKACEVNFSEEELIIKQEIADEDNEKKCTETTPTSKVEKKPMVDQAPNKPIKEVKTENAVSELRLGACKYNEAKTEDPYSFCDKFNCIPCNMKVMTSCHKMRVDLKEINIGSTAKKGKVKKVIWIIYSGCSRHMTCDMALLSKFEEMAGPLVTFGDNNKGFTMGTDMEN
ncbi:hypothetical protein AgCh_031976 [Apium graveolens]